MSMARPIEPPPVYACPGCDGFDCPHHPSVDLRLVDGAPMCKPCHDARYVEHPDQEGWDELPRFVPAHEKAMRRALERRGRVSDEERIRQARGVLRAFLDASVAGTLPGRRNQDF